MEPNQTQQTNPLLVPLAIVIAGALIAGAVYFGGGSKPTTNTQKPTTEIKVEAVSAEDHIVGSRSAEIVIIEYSDTECPFCKVFHNTMKTVVSTYDGKVAWVYRHFPLPQLHAKAMKEAEATECVAELAGEQAFWTYLNRIFDTTNSNDSLDLALLPKMAVTLGIDESEFNTCLSSGRYTEAIKDSIEEGTAAGARGTPYSIIMHKGKQSGTINGAEPLAKIKLKLDALLQ